MPATALPDDHRDLPMHDGRPRLLALPGDGGRPPPATPDYWEVAQGRVSLGEVAPMLAGLQSAAVLFAQLGDRRRATDAGRAADRFAAVYPRPSPGGWQLLGRTDLTLWDAERDPPARLVPGTRVRFREV